MIQLQIKDKYGNEVENGDYVVVELKLWGDIEDTRHGLSLYPPYTGAGITGYLFVGKVMGIYITDLLNIEPSLVEKFKKNSYPRKIPISECSVILCIKNVIKKHGLTALQSFLQ